MDIKEKEEIGVKRVPHYTKVRWYATVDGKRLPGEYKTYKKARAAGEKFQKEKEREEKNIWYPIDSFLKVLRKALNNEWSWVNNQECKYVEVRVDMRTGHCIIKNRSGVRIDPEDLEFQYKYEEGEEKGHE